MDFHTMIAKVNNTSEAMSALRAAIIDAAKEDVSLIGELAQVTESVIAAWNDVCEASPTVGIPELIGEDDYLEVDGAPCCPDPECGGNPCTFPGYADNH